MSSFRKEQISDKDVFLFYFKSPEKHEPFVLDIKQDDYSINRALGHREVIYGTFGGTSIFFMNANNIQLENYWLQS